MKHNRNGKSRKLTRVEQYALLANRPKEEAVSSEKVSVQQRAAGLADEKKAYVIRTNQQVRSLEKQVAHEIQGRRPPEIACERSFDVRASVAQFAPQRGIDIGIWAEGSGFKLVTRGGWYDLESVTNVRKFFRGNMTWQIVTLLSVFVALFCADIWVLCQVPTNTELDVILTIVMMIFSIEFVSLTVSDASYPFSFFFWMDLLGTLSMMFDISYMLGTNATHPARINRKQGRASGNVIVVRAARAARLGARAGRLSRVLKIMKYMPLFKNQEHNQDDKVKMARVISNQLNDVLATRVALLTICVAVTLPIFSMFDYPEVDDSLGAWTQLLAVDADAYFASLHLGHAAVKAAKESLQFEMKRMANFYQDETYGPFSVCLGEKVKGLFECGGDAFDLRFDSVFSNPSRQASIWLMSEGRVQVAFNLATPKRLEAAASVGLIWFIIISMCVFALVLSHSVSEIALQPLERMLSVVRERCAQIFKYTDDLQDDHVGASVEEEEEEQYDETKHANEFVLLEKAVSKLAAIADLSGKPEPDLHEKMDEDDMLVLNMTGVQVPSDATARQLHILRSGSMLFVDEPERQQSDREDDGQRFDEFEQELQGQIPEHIMDLLDTWEFDSTAPTKELNMSLASYFLISSEGCYNWVRANVQDAHIKKFVAAVESQYLPNPFHNFSHALDVCWAVSRFGKLIEAELLLGELAQFWLMIAGLGHDIAHEGTNNQFLIETNHRLALVYNDKSPLENMHCSSLFEILNEPETNVFSMVDKVIFKEVRKGIIAVILHTDITKHAEMVKQLSLLYQMNSDAFDGQGEELLQVLQSPSNSQTVLNMLLHCADINNPMKPWYLCLSLAHKCMEEFFAQGDLEKSAGIPVQGLNDRAKVNTPNSQIGFIEFMIAPMVEAVVRVFPQLDALAENLGMNLKNWLDLWLEESSPPADAVEKTTQRVLKVYAKLMTLIRVDDHS